MADSFDSLLGPTYKAPTVPAPDAVISQTPTPIFDSLVETPRSPAPASPETPIFNSLAGTGNQPSSVTPIFDSIMQTEKPPGSDTPIFDQITKEMDGSTPTPSLGDLLIPRTPPVTVPPPAPEEPGYLSTIGQGLYSGFRRRLPEMVGQGMQFTGLLPEEGKAMAEWAREGEQRPEFKNPLKDWLYQGVEMLAPSVAVPLALSATGAGVLPASLAAGALFGLSQAQQTKETAEKAGVAPGMAPYATGGIEALGETAGTIALQRLFGPLAPVVSKGGKVAIRDIIKPGFSRLMREFFGVTIPVEVGTEIGQQAGEAAVEKYTGIRPDADILREALSVIGPTAVLSAMTLGMAHPLNRIMSRRFETALSDPNVPREIRQQAVDSVSSVLSDADPNLGGLWKIRGTEAVMNGQPIPMDRDVFDWITAKPQTPPGAPAVQPTPPETAAPTLPTTAPGMIPGREAIIQNPPEKTTKGTAINIEPGRPVQPDTVDMEAWQAMKQGRWMDFIGQNIQPEALSQIEQIQKDLGLVVKDGKVFQVGPNGEAIPLSPEKEEAATWALTHRLRVVDDFLKFINQAPLTTEIPKQITGGVNWIPGRPKTILRPGPGIEPPPGEGGFTAGQVQNPKVYVRTPKGNLALVRNPNIPIPSNLPQEGTLPKPLVTTPGVNPAPQPPPAPIQAAPEKPPVTATHLGGPEWMKIGKQAEFYDDKFGRNRVGTISDIIYQGEPPQPSSVTISAGMGKKQRNIELKSDQVNEPTHAVRRKEYFAALQGLKAQERKDTIAGSKQFDNLLIQNAELFVDPGYIDFVYSTAQSDKQKALATHDILDQARAEAGKALKIQDVYNPIRRAENLQTLRDYIEGKRPGGGVAAAHMEAAGNLPMGKNTVLKDGEWLDVSYDEESGKIVLKDGRKFSVAPEEKVEVEQTRVPKETAPTTVPAAEKPAPPPEAPKPPAKPPTPTQQLQARVAIKDLRTGEVFTGSTHADIVMEHGLTPGQGGTEWSAGYEVGGNFY
ncbi:MAG: hypothetical protein NTV04_20100, partial [Deltaproteobacteria bacterium]|nr:hypothetical protein [Deltaproteobacteria bacterium]